MNFVFSSNAPMHSRSALEDLLFFNPRQYRVREGIVNSLARFGHPHLEETGDNLTVRVGTHEAQTLFAYDQDRLDGNPVGIVVFFRTSPDDIAIMHIAVHPDYSLRSPDAQLGLGVELMEKVKECARRITGVRRIVFFYRREIVIRL